MTPRDSSQSGCSINRENAWASLTSQSFICPLLTNHRLLGFLLQLRVRRQRDMCEIPRASASLVANTSCFRTGGWLLKWWCLVSLGASPRLRPPKRCQLQGPSEPTASTCHSYLVSQSFKTLQQSMLSLTRACAPRALSVWFRFKRFPMHPSLVFAWQSGVFCVVQPIMIRGLRYCGRYSTWSLVPWLFHWARVMPTALLDPRIARHYCQCSIRLSGVCIVASAPRLFC